MRRVLINQIIFLASLQLSFNLNAKSSTNFLIIENPFEHRIYNKYEQSLSFNDSSSFLNYCPVEILTEDTVLSDNYTPCFIGKINNRIYYFINPTKTLPIEKSYNSYTHYFKNAVTLNDTVRIIKDDKIIFYQPQNKTDQIFLTKNSRLFRIFKYGTFTYIKILNDPARYGWCNLSGNDAWEIIKSKNDKINTSSNEIKDLIKKKLTSANEMLNIIFNRFNTLNNQHIQPPKWILVHNQKEFMCTLLNNEMNYDFRDSSRILVEELQLALAYSGYKVFLNENQILISRKKQLQD